MANLDELRGYYRQKDVAGKYLDKKVGHIVGLYRHQTQVHILRKIIEDYKIKKLLEIAPGPGRLTSEVKVEKGLAVDSSAEMLNIAQERVGSENWDFTVGDAMNLQTGQKFDMAMSFRFIWHLSYEQRLTCYHSIRSNVSSNGLVVFDTMFHRPLYMGKLRPANMGQVKLFTYKNRKELLAELEEAELELIEIHPYFNHTNIQHIIGRIGCLLGRSFALALIKKIDKVKPMFPQESIVVCRYK